MHALDLVVPLATGMGGSFAPQSLSPSGTARWVLPDVILLTAAALRASVVVLRDNFKSNF
jgi:hypothetical protein